LASYGVLQAQQLAQHLLQVDPPVDLLYSSPFYRCIQTLSPFTDALVEQRSKAVDEPGKDGQGKVKVVVEPGLGEFYGLARFDHPSPAKIEILNEHFPHLSAEKDPVIVPSTKGESIPQLHDRVAYCLHHLIKRADEDPSAPKALLICSHAASMICIGRALTGRMPEDEGQEDFKCFTCAFSKFVRKKPDASRQGAAAVDEQREKAVWNPANPHTVPNINWRNGNGVAGGWTCEVNGDCSFLQGGEERGW